MDRGPLITWVPKQSSGTVTKAIAIYIYICIIPCVVVILDILHFIDFLLVSIYQIKITRITFIWYDMMEEYK